MNMNSGENISVVISGPVFRDEIGDHTKDATALGCLSVRKLLPKAEIVLSTWENTDVSGIDFDRLVLSKDPGPNINNVNRQICSRQAGIRAASREYVLALRSESHIINLNFLDYIDKYQKHSQDSTYTFLKNRIVIAATTPPRCTIFHIGDFYFFGHKSDLLDFWDIPLCDDSKYNQREEQIEYNAHRYLITSFTKKYYPLVFENKTDITRENREAYERIMTENFVITGLHDFGARSYKYPIEDSFQGRLWHYHVSYTFREWKKLYNRLTGEKGVPKYSFEEFFGIHIYSPLYVFRAKVSAVRCRICKYFSKYRWYQLLKRLKSRLLNHK